MDRGAVHVCAGTTLAAQAATWIADEMREAIASRGRCTIALSGGSTPRPAYAALASPPLSPKIAWDKVHVFFADERAVPPTDPESNYGMVEKLLLAGVDISPAHVHRMRADQDDLEAAAADYAHVLPDRLDILVLGMGPDGHTASLFPNAPSLEEQKRLVIPVVGPKPPPRRLTITTPVINAARCIAMLVSGYDKAAMVARTLEMDVTVREVPARLVRRGVWFLDPPAASQLSKRVLRS